MKTKYHRNGTVTLWDIFSQGWARYRAAAVPARILSTLSETERRRIRAIANNNR